MRILFVCLGNICRSPTAENAVRAEAERAGVDLELDSAGTGDWHVGNAPDQRMTDAAREVGLQLVGSARTIRPSDFDEFDLILAMDAANLRDLRGLAPPAAQDRIRLFREFDPEADRDDLDVPDPYHGGPNGFREVVSMVQRTARELVRAVEQGHV